MHTYIYDEIARRRRPMTYLTQDWREVTVGPDTAPVVFPETCPACGAARTAERPGRDCSYACGGGYRDKPQIQNHTDYWWGSCPVKRAEAQSA